MKKSVIIIGVVILIILVIIGLVAFVLSNNRLSSVEKEALINVEKLCTAKTNMYEMIVAFAGEKDEKIENDFKIIEIRKIDEKKLENMFGQTVDKSDIKNEYAIQVDKNGDYRKKEDTTDYTKYNFFAIKYIYRGKMQIAIYIGGYEYNSSEMEDLGIGTWVREAWDMDIFTKDKIDVDKINSLIK